MNKVLIIICECGKVRKHGKWVTLTEDEFQLVRFEYAEGNVELDFRQCPICQGN